MHWSSDCETDNSVTNTDSYIDMKKKEKIKHRLRSTAWELLPTLGGSLSQQGLEQTKQRYNESQPDGWLYKQPASNQLRQHQSSPSNRAYCLAELSQHFINSGGRNHCRYCLPTKGWLDWVGLSVLGDWHIDQDSPVQLSHRLIQQVYNNLFLTNCQAILF